MRSIWAIYCAILILLFMAATNDDGAVWLVAVWFAVGYALVKLETRVVKKVRG